MKSKNIGQKCVRTVSSHVFAGTFAELNNNMILNENFPHGKNSVRLILAKFRLSFNDSQKQRFFNCNMNQLQDRLSHPTRVRGLKQIRQFGYPVSRVAPHTGAWMTTPIWKCIREIRNSGLLESQLSNQFVLSVQYKFR